MAFILRIDNVFLLIAMIKNSEIPKITADQMREVDRLMIEVYGIELLQMMENAGRSLAILSREFFLGDFPTGKHVLVLAGSGGNGGGGLVAARWLCNWGAHVQVLVTRAVGDMQGIPAHQLKILQQMGVPVHSDRRFDFVPNVDLVLDAIIGYSLVGEPHGVAAKLIRIANFLASKGIPVLSLDIPSGMDSTTGEAFEPCICATATMTLALPKTGLMETRANPFVGQLFLADISVPPGLYDSLGIKLPPIFAKGEIIRLS